MDTRIQPSGDIFRRYQCADCKKVYKSVETLFAEGSRSGEISEFDRLRNVHLAVIELLQEVASGRNHLNEIERKLIEAFNAGESEQLKEPLLKAAESQLSSTSASASSVRELRVRRTEPKKRTHSGKSY